VLSVIPASDVAETTVKKVRLIRDVIKLEERAAKYKVHEVKSVKTGEALRLGVLTLPEFYADMQGRKNGKDDVKSCAKDVRKILTQLQEENVDGVLMDLRNNGGGSLPDAIEMTGYFIDKGPVVQVKSSRLRVLKDPNRDSVYEGPLVILVNRQSASASEILAAALQDYGRAVIVGDSKTHGKGSVQTLFPLDRRNPQMGSLKVTTAGFYRIDGSSTQLRGVTPDIIIPSAMDVMEIGEEYLHNVLTLTSVSPALYQMNLGLMEVVPRLKRKSEGRRSKDDRFRAYDKVLERLEENVSRTEISLNFDERLQLSRKNRELEDLQKKLNGVEEDDKGDKGENGDEEEDDKNDLILEETLNILRDLVDEIGSNRAMLSARGH
jgi:carboxyl-terminal processing protease